MDDGDGNDDDYDDGGNDDNSHIECNDNNDDDDDDGGGNDDNNNNKTGTNTNKNKCAHVLHCFLLIIPLSSSRFSRVRLGDTL